MNIVRAALTGAVVVVLSACSLPGLKYEDGGSEVWKGQDASAGPAPEIKEITPGLAAQMAQQAYEQHQQLAAQTTEAPAVAPWVYRVGVGDVLSVIVWDHPELTNPAGTTMNVDSSGRVVRPDGTIFYPYAGDVKVAGKTAAEIRELLTRGIAHSIQSPQVDVKVLLFRSQFVNVVGDIDQPCRLPITETPITLIDAISQCRILRAAAMTSTSGTNDNSLYANRDIEIRRDGKRRVVDLYAIYKGRDPLFYEPLLGGDTVYIRDERQNRVFIVGEVTRQGALYIPVSGLSLADALNDNNIGGINQQTADTRNIYVFRGGLVNANQKQDAQANPKYQPEIFHLNLKSADALLLADQFQLQPRDVIFASASPLVSYSRTASLIIPTISTLIQTGILINATR
jgi:polysaccharide export outer membrane protein